MLDAVDCNGVSADEEAEWTNAWLAGGVWGCKIKDEFKDEDEDIDELLVSFRGFCVVDEVVLLNEWFECVDTLLLDRRSRWLGSDERSLIWSTAK